MKSIEDIADNAASKVWETSHRNDGFSESAISDIILGSISEAILQERNRTCVWERQVNPFWFNTSCGIETCESDRMVYCGACGGKIVVKNHSGDDLGGAD